jgi:hypothetical protein
MFNLKSFSRILKAGIESTRGEMIGHKYILPANPARKGDFQC